MGQWTITTPYDPSQPLNITLFRLLPQMTFLLKRQIEEELLDHSPTSL